MAYTIIRSDGTVLTTIQDGTMNTGSTSLSLPGRNFAGFGQAQDTNFVRMVENFANSSPPSNPIRGQLWYNTALQVMNICPADGTTNANAWLTITSTTMGGTSTFANIVATGNITANNASFAHDIYADTITVRLANVTSTLTSLSANISSANITSTRTATITTGSATTAGTITGSWTAVGNSSGNAFSVLTGNIAFAEGSVNGVKCDTYMYSNGAPFNPTGTYTNGNVFDYMTGANVGSGYRFGGDIYPNSVTTTHIAGGGVISGVWTLDTGARIEATYADLAERFASDTTYECGTVVELGGVEEITAVKEELSDKVFGVISMSAGYLMNSRAGSDKTHPAVAISGRVPVKVLGKISKGDRLVSAGNGMARAAKQGEPNSFNTIGRSLTEKFDDAIGTIEAIVTIR